MTGNYANWKFRIVWTFFTTVCCTSMSDAQCSETSAGIKRFGPDCRHACHCMSKEQCDSSTGDCTSGCDFEWAGPDCQYNNIALNEEVRHSDNINPPKYSYNANDRDLSTCSFTDTAEASRTVAPWWTLWLPYYVRFRNLVIVTKMKHLSHFPGFSLTVQNVSKEDSVGRKYHSDGKLCHQHNDSIPTTETMYIRCAENLVGHQIRLQLANVSTQLVICDVRVYGDCKDRTWGDSCEKMCGFCYNLESCNSTTGYCMTGCESGYKTEPVCTEASPAGYFGSECKQLCSGYCVGGQENCDNVHGTCLYGCTVGWTGRTCKEVCDNGTYGQNCSFKCSGHCKHNAGCNKQDGTCQDGCTPGYTGEKCDLCFPSLISIFAVNCVIIPPVLGYIYNRILAVNQNSPEFFSIIGSRYPTSDSDYGDIVHIVHFL